MPDPAVYFARAVDGLQREDIVAEAQVLAAELELHGLRLVDPVAEWARAPGYPAMSTASVTALVGSDLALLRKSDCVLMDMSIRMRDYIGCVCELTYAYMWRIPSVVWVGDTGFDERVWLRYHATTLVREKATAVAAVIKLLTDQSVLASSPTE